MIQERAAVPLLAVLRHVPPLVPFVEVSGEGHVQLHSGGLRRQDSEAVLSNDQGQTAAIVPFHMELPSVIDVFQCAHGTGRHWVVGVFHLSELDPAPCGVLLPQKGQPFSRRRVHSEIPPIVMPSWGAFS